MSTNPHSGLRRTLQRRHMEMIALGGVIGAGLFVGSGVVIQAGRARRRALVRSHRCARGAGDAHARGDGGRLPRGRRLLRIQPPCAWRTRRVHDRMDVLVLLGHRGRARGGGGRTSADILVSARLALAVHAQPHAGVYAAESAVRALVGRVRVLVRLDQGGRDRRCSCAWAWRSSRPAWPRCARRPCQPHRATAASCPTASARS